MTAHAVENAVAGGGEPSAPGEDRVGFPKEYAKTFEILRTVDRLEKQQVVTVFGNVAAASVRASGDLPYPYGSVIVMETSGALKDEPPRAAAVWLKSCRNR